MSALTDLAGQLCALSEDGVLSDVEQNVRVLGEQMTDLQERLVLRKHTVQVRNSRRYI